MRSRATAAVAERLSGWIWTMVLSGVMAGALLQPAAAQTCSYSGVVSGGSGPHPTILIPPSQSSGQLTSSPGCSAVMARSAISDTVQTTVLDIRQSVMQRILRPGVPPLDIDPAQGDVFAPRRASAPSPYPDSARAPDPGSPSGSSGGATLHEAIGPDWLYGVNLIGSGDKGIALNTEVSVSSVVGAVDVTKIGIFSSTDALTFIGTGIHSWTTTRGDYLPDTSSTIPSTSATVAYLNGGFSTDFTVLASWTPSTAIQVGDSSAIGYTANVQYRYDGPHAVWFEPTVGVTYGELFNGSFAQKTSDSTEIHGGLRFGAETRWMGYTVQPTLSGVAFKVVDQNGLEQVWSPALMNTVNPSGAVGFRGSAKMTVLWTKAFSSYIDLHATTMSSPEMPNIQVIGVQGGLRYTF
ncbi:MAG: hypothetical protein FWD68_02595 [Alphaproteobacteria bacterium]|nr:hypothetical protein [Alphaproteobacteria bacterium]